MVIVGEAFNLFIHRHGKWPVKWITNKCGLPAHHRLTGPASFGESYTGEQISKKNVEMRRRFQIRFADVAEGSGGTFRQQWADPKRGARSQRSRAGGMQMIGDGSAMKLKVRALERTDHVAGIPTGVDSGVGH